MNYHKYHPVDVINGPGTRCSLFVSGCEHKCKGCYNATTWNPCSGHLFEQQLEDRIIADLQDSRIKRRGLSLSGGDPMHPANLTQLIQLCQRVKQECPGKDIWCWTGYELDQLSSQQQELLEYIDVLIDGRFEKDQADANLLWRGSHNQVIHYLSKQADSAHISQETRKCA